MKRKLFSLALVLLMALTMAAIMPAMAEEINLVTNGDFEYNEPVLDEGGEQTGVTYTKADGVTPFGWRSVTDNAVYVSPDDTTETKVRACLMAETIGEGDAAVTNHYLKITNTADTDNRFAFCTDVRLEPGKTYKLSVKSIDLTTPDEDPTKEQGRLEINPTYNDAVNGSNDIAIVRLYSNRWLDATKYENKEWINHEVFFTVPATAVPGEDGKTNVAFRFGQRTNSVDFALDDFSLVECPNGTYSATLDAGEDGVISPGEEVTVAYEYGRTFTGYSGMETFDEKTTYDADPFQIITCVYREENGKKVLCGVTLTDADAGCAQAPNNKTMGIYDFYGDKANTAKKVFSGKTIASIAVTAPTENGIYTIKTFAWDGISGLQARAHAITLGGSAE